MAVVDTLRERFGAQFKENEPLAKHVNLRIGGPADFFVEAKSSQDIIDAVTLAKASSLSFFILGGGSNTLVSDVGFHGLVIKAANRTMRIDGTKVFAEAGVIAASVARASAEAGLTGFEWAISLPGTIGGGVRGNAGCFGGEMKDSIESVRVLRNGVVETLTNANLKFGYRHSTLKDLGNSDVILDVILSLKQGDRTEALANIDKNLAGRKASQPLGASSAGCMFKNFEWTDDAVIEHLQSLVEIPPNFLAAHRIPAGWIIDKLNLKGTSINDAEVSPQHGNFLLNKGHATASDISTLVDLIKKNVEERSGIRLEEEVMRLGF